MAEERLQRRLAAILAAASLLAVGGCALPEPPWHIGVVALSDLPAATELSDDDGAALLDLSTLGRRFAQPSSCADAVRDALAVGTEHVRLISVDTEAPPLPKSIDEIVRTKDAALRLADRAAVREAARAARARYLILLFGPVTEKNRVPPPPARGGSMGATFRAWAKRTKAVAWIVDLRDRTRVWSAESQSNGGTAIGMVLLVPAMTFTPGMESKACAGLGEQLRRRFRDAGTDAAAG